MLTDGIDVEVASPLPGASRGDGSARHGQFAVGQKVFYASLQIIGTITGYEKPSVMVDFGGGRLWRIPCDEYLLPATEELESIASAHKKPAAAAMPMRSKQVKAKRSRIPPFAHVEPADSGETETMREILQPIMERHV